MYTLMSTTDIEDKVRMMEADLQYVTDPYQYYVMHANIHEALDELLKRRAW